MTSTNDGKDVKSYQTSGQKGKKYYIELYNSLDAYLNSDCDLRARTAHLCSAWACIHVICSHALPASHPLLLAWLERHTARIVLQTEWQSPGSKDEHVTFTNALDAVVQEIADAVTERDGTKFPWEGTLETRAQWFKGVLSNPWDHPVLRVLLNPTEPAPSDDDVIEWLKGERDIVFVTRLRQLVASKCDDLATSLASAVMDRVRAARVIVPDAEQAEEQKDKPSPSEDKPPTFEDRLRLEAGFTEDVWALLTDIEFVLLLKVDKRARCIELAKQTPFRNGYELIQRLQKRLENAKNSRDKRLWKNATEVATLIAQVVIARCMVVPVWSGVARGALYWCTRALAGLLPPAQLRRSAVALAAPATTSHHLYWMAKAVHMQKNTEERKPFVCELYVRAITFGMNELEKLKLDPQKEPQARLAEQTLATWFLELGGLFASERFKCECTLTAFSVHPSPDMYKRIEDAPPLPKIAVDQQEPKDEVKSEFGSWATDSRSQTNFVKTSEHLNMKQSQQQANVLSTAILTEGEALGLEVELCQDITVLLSGPRLKTLSWDMDRTLLLDNCRNYMERTGGGTRALTTELKYLNINPDDFLHLPEEEDDENDLYYGIEKGYEHLVEFQEPEPVTIWDDIWEASETAYSSDTESDHTTLSRISRRKKKEDKSYSSDSDECDPLSLIAAECKKKKERPHSKERRRQKKERSNSKDKKEKKERKKKDKVPKQTEQPPSSLSSLVGIKVSRVDNKSESEQNSQVKSSQSENNNQNIINDRQSMDPLKPPERRSSVESVKTSLSSLNGAKVLKAVALLNPDAVLKPDKVSKVKKVKKPRQKKQKPESSLKQDKPSTITKKQTSYDDSNLEVKRKISKLLQFRRKKLAGNSSSQHPSDAVKIELSSLVGSKIVQPSEIKAPETPKVTINSKQQTQKVNALSEEVNNLLLSNKLPTGMKIVHPDKCVDLPMNIDSCSRTVPYKIDYSKRKTAPNILAHNYPQLHPVNLTTNVDSKNISQVQLQHNLPNNLYVESKTIINNKPAEPLPNFDVQQKNFQQFLRELQGSNNAGVEKPKEKVPTHKASHGVLNTASLDYTASSPSAKAVVLHKKVDNAPNTFARMSYMHKKLVETKPKQVKSELNQVALHNSISAELDERVAEFHKLKTSQNKGFTVSHSKQLESPRIEVQSVKKSHEIASGHPLLTDMLKSNTVGVLNTTSLTDERFTNIQQIKPSIPIENKSTLSEKDQQDLLFLLRQKNYLNESLSQKQRETTVIKNTKTFRVPCSTTNYDLLNVSSTNQTPASVPTVIQNKAVVISNADAVRTADMIQDNKTNLHQETKPTATNENFPKAKNANVLKKPNKKQTDIKEDWTKVLDAIRAHKTPRRGPNALEMVMKKESYEKFVQESSSNKNLIITAPKEHIQILSSGIQPNREVNPVLKEQIKISGSAHITTEKIKTNISLQKSKIACTINSTKTGGTFKEFPKKPAQSIKISNPANINVSNTTCGNKTKNTVLKQVPLSTKINIAPPIEVTRKPTDSTKSYPSDIFKRNNDSRTFLCDMPKQDDPFISGLQNSDYDLLEELMDDELKQEIGELSDEERLDSIRSVLSNEPNTKVQQNRNSYDVKEIQNAIAKDEPKIIVDIRGILNKDKNSQSSSTFIENNPVKTNKIQVVESKVIKPPDNMNWKPESVPGNQLPLKTCIQMPKVSPSLTKSAYLSPKDIIVPSVHEDKAKQSINQNKVHTTAPLPTQMSNNAITNPLLLTTVTQALIPNVVVVQNNAYSSYVAPQTVQSHHIPTNIYIPIDTTPNVQFQVAVPTPTPVVIENTPVIATTSYASNASFSGLDQLAEAANYITTLNNKMTCMNKKEDLEKSRNIPKNVTTNTENKVTGKKREQPLNANKSVSSTNDNKTCANKKDDLEHRITVKSVTAKSNNKSNINKKEDVEQHKKQHSLDETLEKNLKTKIQDAFNQKIEMYSAKVDFYVKDINKNERKVLSEVQEKLKSSPEKTDLKQPKSTRTSVEHEPKKDKTDDQDRLINKRLSIIHREINQRCFYPPIPLTYASLKDQGSCASEYNTKTTPETISSKENQAVDEYNTKTAPEIISSKENQAVDEYNTKTAPEIISSKENQAVDEHNTKTAPEIISSKENQAVDEYNTKTAPEIISSKENQAVDEYNTKTAPEIISSKENQAVDEYKTKTAPEITSSKEKQAVDEYNTKTSPEIISSKENQAVDESRQLLKKKLCDNQTFTLNTKEEQNSDTTNDDVGTIGNKIVAKTDMQSVRTSNRLHMRKSKIDAVDKVPSNLSSKIKQLPNIVDETKTDKSPPVEKHNELLSKSEQTDKKSNNYIESSPEINVLQTEKTSDNLDLDMVCESEEPVRKSSTFEKIIISRKNIPKNKTAEIVSNDNLNKSSITNEITKQSVTASNVTPKSNKTLELTSPSNSAKLPDVKEAKAPTEIKNIIAVNSSGAMEDKVNSNQEKLASHSRDTICTTLGAAVKRSAEIRSNVNKNATKTTNVESSGLSKPLSENTSNSSSNEIIILDSPVKTNAQKSAAKEIKNEVVTTDLLDSKITQEFKNNIQIEEIPRSEWDDPLKRMIRIKLPNGKSFRAKVFGAVPVSFSTLFSDPTFRQILYDGINEKKQFKLSIQNYATPNQLVIPNITDKIIPNAESVETVDLVSDDEDDLIFCFTTEFGKFTVKSITKDLGEKHQLKFTQKCFVKISRCKTESQVKKAHKETSSEPPSKYEDKKFQDLVDAALKEKLSLQIDTQLKNTVVPNEVIEIDDSSNDSVICADTNTKPTQITELKSLLLAELGVKDVGSESNNKMVKELHTNDVVEVVDNVEVQTKEMKITHQGKTIERKILKKDFSEVLKRNCFVKLVRCDHLVNTVDDSSDESIISELIVPDSDVEEIVENTLSRCESVSLLQDLSVVDDELISIIDSSDISGATSPVMQAFESIVALPKASLGRTSPVMEIYDLISSVYKKTVTRYDKKHSMKPSEDSIICYSDWLETKSCLQSFSKVVELDKEIMQVQLNVVPNIPVSPEKLHEGTESSCECNSDWFITKSKIYQFCVSASTKQYNPENYGEVTARYCPHPLEQGKIGCIQTTYYTEIPNCQSDWRESKSSQFRRLIGIEKPKPFYSTEDCDEIENNSKDIRLTSIMSKFFRDSDIVYYLKPASNINLKNCVISSKLKRKLPRMSSKFVCKLDPSKKFKVSSSEITYEEKTSKVEEVIVHDSKTNVEKIESTEIIEGLEHNISNTHFEANEDLVVNTKQNFSEVTDFHHERGCSSPTILNDDLILVIEKWSNEDIFNTNETPNKKNILLNDNENELIALTDKVKNNKVLHEPTTIITTPTINIDSDASTDDLDTSYKSDATNVSDLAEPEYSSKIICDDKCITSWKEIDNTEIFENKQTLIENEVLLESIKPSTLDEDTVADMNTPKILPTELTKDTVKSCEVYNEIVTLSHPDHRVKNVQEISVQTGCNSNNNLEEKCCSPESSPILSVDFDKNIQLSSQEVELNSKITENELEIKVDTNTPKLSQESIVFNHDSEESEVIHACKNSDTEVISNIEDNISVSYEKTKIDLTINSEIECEMKENNKIPKYECKLIEESIISENSEEAEYDGEKQNVISSDVTFKEQAIDLTESDLYPEPHYDCHTEVIAERLGSDSPLSVRSDLCDEEKCVVADKNNDIAVIKDIIGISNSPPDLLNQNDALVYKDESGVLLKGVEYEDPEMGTLYVFPLVKSSDTSGDSEVLNSSGGPLVDNNPDDDLRLLVPEFTYSKQTRKRKARSCRIEDFDEKRARRSPKATVKYKFKKAKKIDYRKTTITSINEACYAKEYNRLIHYYSTLQFSYSIPFGKEFIDVPELLYNWPLKSSVNDAQIEEEEDSESDLFTELETSTIFDPLNESLAEEITKAYSEEFSEDEEDETNFNMGFGEGSGRVKQNLVNVGTISELSAATLSDVKQSQPFLLSEDYDETLDKTSKCSQNDQIEKIKRYISYIRLKDKVRSFFKRNTVELTCEYYKLMTKPKTTEDLSFPFDLFNFNNFQPPPVENIVQVVQVGQLPVSAAAQNPVTCDPRVTQVSDASLSQCTVDNGPHDESQPVIKTEYTELTTADLSVPLQNYTEHDQPMQSVQSQETANMSAESLPINPELIKSEVKIELMEETEDNQYEYPKIHEPVSYSTEPQHETHHVKNNAFSYNANSTVSSEPDPTAPLLFSSPVKEEPVVKEEPPPESEQKDIPTEKNDQIAHAMNAAGITTTMTPPPSRAHTLLNLLSTQKVRQNVATQNTTNSFQKASSNTMSLQQALAQILPPPLNQTTNVDSNIQNQPMAPQVLHIVQGKNASGNQITLLDNSQHQVINAPNATPVLHIVQNKTAVSGVTSNGTPNPQQNTFSGLSLVDAGLQQGGNQLLHIVNTGNQKNNTGPLLKRVNLLTNIANVQGSNEQKMVQFVCKSADGKAIQLNAPAQRGMVLRLQPIETPHVQAIPQKPAENQEQNQIPTSVNSAPPKEPTPSQQQDLTKKINSRSGYEENYAKFIQNSSQKPQPEKSTSLPKFNQAFGKPVFQEESQKNEINSNNSHLSVGPNAENTECPPVENSINLEHLTQLSSPPLLLRKTTAPHSHAQPNLVQQIKQTIAPMNIQTMHGGVIYTRQIPVNIGGGQTINLITVPTADLIDDKQQNENKFSNQGEMEPSIIKIVPQTQAAPAEGTDVQNHVTTNENPQPQPVLTQMRIKLPMLSKAPQMVAGARVVRPSFFQIQRNVVGGPNQPVYQQLVLTAAPPLGQQTIRLPQAQTRPIKVPSESQSSTESMSSSTLEQLREFDMVLEQVKERSTVQPNSNSNFKIGSTDTTDSAAPATQSPTETTQQVLYSIGSNQSVNVAYVNRKAPVTTTTPLTTSFVRSPDSSGITDSPTSSTHNMPVTHTVTSESSGSDTPAPKPHKSKKSRSKSSSHLPNSMKINSVTPKTSSQKPLEDEQTTQRILYILAEYKEQVENSPDKDKPAPRRRSNPPSSGSSKRKKSSSGSRRSGRDVSPSMGEDTSRTMGSEDSSCGTSQGDCTENCIEPTSPQDSPRKVVRKLTFEQEQVLNQSRPQPQRNVIVADGQTITVARGATGKPATAVLMPANYILPVSMVKGGQQIAIVTNRGPKLLTVGGGEGGATNAVLLQRLIGPAGLKPVLARPGVRHVRLPTAALHNLQAFNLTTTTTVQQPPPDSTASPASVTTPPDLVDTRVENTAWHEEPKPERTSSPEGSEPWNLPTAADPHDYSYEETVRTDNLDRTVLDPIPDRYSPDMEAQRIFDKMFDVESKKSYIVDSHDDSPRCGYDIDASDDDKGYQVVHKKDGTARQHRLAHVSAAALRHKYAILEHELRLQKSLSEECEDLGVDSPSASELFPEAELLFASSPAQEHHQDHGHHATQPLLPQSVIQPDIDDQIATDQLLPRNMTDDRQDLDVNLGLEDVGIVTVSEDGMQATIALDQEEFARSHPNTTFHSEPTDEGEVQPFTITTGIKSRQITSTIFHSNRAPATVLMTAPQTSVISQATGEPSQNHVKYDLDNMLHTMPSSHGNHINLSSVLVNKDDGLTRYDNILNDSRELHLSNTASAIVHATGNATQVIRRVCYEDDKRERDRYLMDEPEGLIAGEDAKMISDDATLGSMVDDVNSSPERHTELFWESNSASERSESRRPLDFSSDSDKCCKSPSYDETNSTDSSGVGTHMRLDSVIKDARGIERSGSAGSSADDTHPPLRTYPAKRSYHNLEDNMERSLSGKTRAGERSPDSLEVRRRASLRGVVKRGCHCCNGSPAPPRPKKPRQKKPSTDFIAN